MQTLISPLHVRSAPGEAATKGREDQFIAFLQFITVVPQAEWQGRRSRVTIFFDVDHDLFHGEIQHACHRTNNAHVGLMWSEN